MAASGRRRPATPRPPDLDSPLPRCYGKDGDGRDPKPGPQNEGGAAKPWTPEQEERPWLQTLGEILPEAARRYGDKTALIIDGRSLTFNALEAQSNAFANGLAAAGIAAGRHRHALRPQLLAMDGGLLRHRQDRRGGEPGQHPAHPGGGEVHRQGLAAPAPSSPRRTRPAPLMDMKANTGLSQVVIWGDKAPAGATPFERWLEQRQADLHAAAAHAQGYRRHLLHLGHHRPPQGRGAEPALHRRHGQGHGAHALAHQRRHRS